MLHVCTWIWGTKYGPEYVARLQSGLQRNISEPFAFRILRPGLCDEPLIAGCFCRLRMFDQQWQEDQGINPGDRIVCIDLDVVITGELAPLFYRAEPFLILQGANSANPNPFNGSLWMFRAGYCQQLWTEFSLEKSRTIRFHEYPDDQGWFWHKLPNAAGWKVGPSSGIYAFKKPQWPKGDDLPNDARLVVFPGWRDPAKFTHLPWIRRHWS